MPSRGQAGAVARVTLRDVAQLAGVSMSTASLVFSGNKPVAQDTAGRVRAAAERLGYTGPHPMASSLRHGRSGVIAAVVERRILHAFRDPYVVAVLDGLSQVVGEMGSGLLLLPDATEGHGDPGPQVSRIVADAAVFMLCGDENNALATQFAARGVPVVGTGAPCGPGIVQVEVPERDASARVARHLRDLGHRTVGHIMMPLAWGNETGLRTLDTVRRSHFPDTRERALGVRDVFARAALVEAAEADFDSGYAAANLLLDRPDPPTAIIAQSDLLAAGAVQAASDRGLRVPEDLSVTGFDGVSLPWFGRELTTIDQRPLEKGRAVGEVVRDLLAGDEVGDVSFEVSLRVGDTTGPAPDGPR
ncbi:LacI family DNA-binding transcriptional regulator [Flexivirga aerilata]|uniref:LacI family DNA-binding transcriptional regulator n=1 Tax=Flexivirga aerilata TaxID=1656889 RepID=UPI001BB23249|nr:LacI family DNA-binding transcriptional regulator [Flexivirga aerilata]